MYSFKERLQELFHNKAFAYTSVVLFAFFTALLFALLSNSSTTGSGNPLDAQNYQRNGGNGQGGSQGGALNKAQSPIDRLISIITGRKATNPSDTTSGTNTGANTGGTGTQPSRDGRIRVSTGSNPQEILNKIKQEARAVPRIAIGRYNITTPLPSVPTEAFIHQIKTNYTQSEIESMARSLGFIPFNSADIVTEKSERTSHYFDIQNQLYLGMDKVDGSFVFVAENPVQLASTGGGQAGINQLSNSASAQQVALGAARTLGFDHPCFQATAPYTKDADPGFTFVDVHCTWDGAGAPIISTLGMMNMPNTSPLNQVKLGQFGFENVEGVDERPDEFNTMTVKLDQNNGVKLISSNLMKIISTATVPGVNILEPEQAVNRLSANQADFGITTPSGAGFVDFDVIYPNNQASAEEVNLTDFMLAYNIVPGFTENYLCPVWVTRSSGDVSSGYNATFIQTVKAVNDSRCASPKLMTPAAVASANVVSTQSNTPTQPVSAPTTFVPERPSPIERFPSAPDTSDDTLHYEDFYIQPAQVVVSCPEAATFTNAYQINTNTYLAWKHKINYRRWYVAWTAQDAFTSDTGNGTQLSNQKRNEYILIRERIYARECPRTNKSLCDIPDAPAEQQGFAQTQARDNSNLAGLQERIVACQLLTTGSPSLYFYPSRAMNVSVTLDPFQGVEYAHPYFTNADQQMWKLKAATDGALTFADGAKNHRAYYEFKKYALISRLGNYKLSDRGITTSNTVAEVGKAVDSIAQRLGLTQVETKDLKAEMLREAAKVASKSVVISLLPVDFVNEELPVSINPEPKHFYRAIFLITGRESGSAGVATPSDNLDLPYLERNGFTVVETGVLSN